MSKSRVFIGIAICFAAGILAASGLEIPREYLYIYLALTLSAFALTFLNEKTFSALLALFLFAFGLGALRLQLAQVSSEYERQFGEKLQMEGYVVKEADVRDGRQLLYILPKNHAQNILVTTTLAQEFFYGDLVVIEGKVAEPKSFEDFDYKGYLERFNVYAQMSYPKILILKSHQLNPAKEALLKIKQLFVKQLGLLFTEPQNSLLLGILIGAKKNLPVGIVDNFNATGTSHIIAISGFNITIMISALAVLARLLGRKFSFWFTVFVIIAFVVITGASASVVRAAIMGFLLLLSFNIGRQYSVGPALFFAALVMLVVNPKILFWDVGFQLSFAATLGIVYFSPLFGIIFSKAPEAWGAKTLLLTTFAAIISTMPLILYNFQRLSLSAPLANLLILPIVPWAMLFGFLSIVPVLGPGFSWLANWLLLYILKVTAFLAALPYSSVNLTISTLVFWIMMALVPGLYFFLSRIFAGEKKRNIPAGNIS
ncbi:MAG: ComEC/Rec2 family competence protein [Candidatus Doudnabacteria bacterium]|nr:ComEC/Rec2 family competence protein [Candidatus Doudnabacteria bacterium]